MSEMLVLAEKRPANDPGLAEMSNWDLIAILPI